MVCRTRLHPLGVLLIGVVGILIIWGCLGEAAEPTEYRFGVIIPLTGRGASGGERIQQGIELAVEDINQRGGIKGAKLKTQWLGYSGFENQDSLDLAASVAEGARYTMAEARGPKAEAFFKAYEARYGKQDVEYSVYAWYDAVQIFAAALQYALEKGWEYKGASIIRALQEMPPYEEVFGKTAFAEDGTVRKPITIKTVKNGWWAEVKTYSLEKIKALP